MSVGGGGSSKKDGEEASNNVGSKQGSVVSWKTSEESVSTEREHLTG